MTDRFFQLESGTMGALRASGSISFTNAAAALAQLPLPIGGAEFKVDLNGLEAADSATLAVLMAWSAAARRAGTTLRYLRAPQALRNLAKLGEVDGLLGIA